MNIELFKNQIENKKVQDSILIFKVNDNTDFIIDQYCKEIANIKNLEIKIIESIDYNTLKYNDYYLFIYRTDEFNDENLSKFKNLIIITKNISDDCKWMFSNDIIEFPSITDWMIKDYIASNLNGFTENNVEDLFIRCNKNLFRIDNEIFKLKNFNDPNVIYDDYKETINDFSDTTFNLVNNIIDKDFDSIYSNLKNINSDFNFIGFYKLLKSSFRKIIDIQLNPQSSGNSLGISDKQFWYYKYNKCNKYNKLQLLKIYDLLTSIDIMLKTGKFYDINLLDYLLMKIYYIGVYYGKD